MISVLSLLPASSKNGHAFEKAFFGINSIEVDPRFREHKPGTLEEEINLVKGIQPALRWNPRQPILLGKHLHEAVAQVLTPELRKHLRLFNSLGTHLDAAGVDGFFELGGDIVTIDLTTRSGKEYSADQLVTYGHFRRGIYHQVGLMIAQKLVPGMLSPWSS
jgi:hypothetical protein